MDDGRWTMDDGRWTMERASAVHRLSSIVPHLYPPERHRLTVCLGLRAGGGEGCDRPSLGAVNARYQPVTPGSKTVGNWYGSCVRDHFPRLPRCGGLERARSRVVLGSR